MNPCYPNYAIRELYTNFGHDFVFLVGNNLARRLLERVQKYDGMSSGDSVICYTLIRCSRTARNHFNQTVTPAADFRAESSDTYWRFQVPVVVGIARCLALGESRSATTSPLSNIFTHFAVSMALPPPMETIKSQRSFTYNEIPAIISW